MRHSILGLVVYPVLAFTATPVFAEAADILDRYKATMEILVGDVTNPEANRKKIFDGLDGDWFAIGTLRQPKSTQQNLICFANLRVLEE